MPKKRGKTLRKFDEIINIYYTTDQDVWRGYPHRKHRTRKTKKEKSNYRRNNRLERYDKKELIRELNKWR